MFQDVKVCVFCVLCLQFFGCFWYVFFVGDLQMLNLRFFECMQFLSVFILLGKWVGFVWRLLFVVWVGVIQQLFMVMYLYLVVFMLFDVIVLMMLWMMFLLIEQLKMFQLFQFIGGVRVRVDLVLLVNFVRVRVCVLVELRLFVVLFC